MEKNKEIKSSNNFGYSASGIKFNFKMKAKNKISRKEYIKGEEYSCEIELEEEPEINKKSKNEIGFKPSTKQTVDKNKYKTLKKKYNIEEEYEIKEEKEDDEAKEEKKSKINTGKKTPPSRQRKNIYTEKNHNNKIILDNSNEEEEEQQNIEKNKVGDKLNNSLDSNKRENKNKYNEDNNYKISKGLKSVGGDLEGRKNKRLKTKKNKKWNENEYQRLKSESKNYIPFNEFNINKYLLTLTQMNNIKQIPELYNKYLEFISLKKKQDQMQKDILIKNILKILKNIYKYETYYNTFKVNSLINEENIEKFEYKSNEKTAFFDLFLSFISIYVDGSDNFVELSSIPEQKKLMVPLHILAYIFSSQAFFCDMAKLIQNSYDKFLAYKIIPIYIKENEEFRYKINARQKIWKQFEDTYLYYKNDKKLYLTNEKGESIIDNKKIENFSEEIKNDVKSACDEITEKIIEKHEKINQFNINDENINLTNKEISAPSSLYNQINKDISLKLEMIGHKYYMQRLRIKKAFILNNATYQKKKFNNIVKNKLFKQSVFYMNPGDVVQDFLDNFD